MLRLMSSDLVLDEPDDFDQSDLPALTRLVHWAGPDIPALLEAWESDANWMKQQPGCISTQLHRGIAGSTV